MLGQEDLTLVTITHRIKDGLLERYDRIIEMEDRKENPKMESPEQEKKEEGHQMQMVQLQPGQNIADVLRELQEKHGGEMKVLSAGSFEEAQKMMEEMQSGKK